MNHSRGALAQPVAGPIPTSMEGGAASLYIINLSSANTPMLLEAPDAPELGGFAVFRSRRVEDGRERFRLHLGYFDSQQQAEKFLPLVRDRYPTAWVAQAPQDSMGSLDDTSVAQFKFIPTRKAGSTAAVQPKPAPTVATAKPASAPSVTAPSPAPTAADAATVPAERLLEAEDVLSLLESPPRTLPSVQEKPVARPMAQAPAPVPVPKPTATRTLQPVAKPAAEPTAVPTEQSFAVQLIWSAERPDTAQLPRLAIFDAYTMYTVTVQRAGRVWYGLRLGFFNDPVSARQVALYVRSDFSAASVVPVSERECGKAEEAAKTVLQKEAAIRQQPKSEPARPQPAWAASLSLQDEPAAPAPLPTIKPPTEAASAQEQFRKSLENMDRPLPPPKAKAKPKKAGTAGKAATSTEQLIEELGAHAVSLEDEEGNTFTDTGVRHLSVAVVKPSKRKGLFGRGK